MSVTEFIEGLKKLPDSERERIFASLVENEEWREDLLDLMTLSERQNEPNRPIDAVFKDLNIDA
jgi:hypothetical protein